VEGFQGYCEYDIGDRMRLMIDITSKVEGETIIAGRTNPSIEDYVSEARKGLVLGMNLTLYCCFF
jgi:hypothetical protein